MTSSNEVLQLWIKLADEEFGDTAERESVFELEDRLIAAIEEPGVGEFDGNEFGDGWCVLYMYGESADRLLEAAIPVIRDAALPPGSHLLKRYGEPGAPEERIGL